MQAVIKPCNLSQPGLKLNEKQESFRYLFSINRDKKDTKYCLKKQGPNIQKKHKQME